MGSPDPLTAVKHQVILFDGVCNLCNSAVQFIIRRDKKETFRFASLQSSLGRKLLGQHPRRTSPQETIILFKNNKVYDRSTAALEIAKELPGAWPAFYIFMILPKFLRDSLYNLIARNRYRWFGKKDECMIPTAEVKNRFLEV